MPFDSPAILARSTRPRESLSAGEPLGIFRNVQFVEPTDAAELVTWEKLQTREIRLAVTQAPANGFQQMIRWTRQGKLWHFPINNEQGSRSAVYFTHSIECNEI